MAVTVKIGLPIWFMLVNLLSSGFSFQSLLHYIAGKQHSGFLQVWEVRGKHKFQHGDIFTGG